MLRLAVCPHDTETKKGIRRWQEIAKDISKIIKEEVVFEPFKDFQDELEKLKTQTYHIYYANLNAATELFKKGYKVVGTYKEEKETGIFLKRKDRKLGKYIKLASVKVPIVVFPFVMSNLDIQKVDLLLFSSFKQAMCALKENVANLALVHSETYKQMEKENWFEKYSEVSIPHIHFFMVHPDVEEKLTKTLLSLPYIEKVKDFEFEYILAFNRLAKAFLETTESIQIKKAIDNSPQVMHTIHKNTIAYANDIFCKTLGYQKEEILNTNLIEYIQDQEVKERITKDIQRQLKGENVVAFYPNVKLLAKDKSARYFNIYSNTIVYDGSYSTYILAVDITREKKLEVLKNLLHKINRAASGSLSEHELYQRVCKALVDDVGLRMAWVGAPGEDKWFKVLCSYGFLDGYLDNIKIYSTPELPEGRGPTGTTYTTGEVIIIDDTRTNPRFTPWKERAIQRGYLSVAGIPIKRKGKVLAVLTMYADEPNFFDEETRQVLEQLSSDLSFFLEFIEQLKSYSIINTALENSDTWVLVTDTDGNILYVNDAVTRISGYTKEELIGKNPRIFKSGYQSKNFYKQLWDTILSDKEFESVFVNRSKSGKLLYLHQRIIPVILPDGTKRFVSVGRDITKEHHMSEEIQRLNYYDPLTGLLNYRGFRRKLEDVLPKTEKAFLILLDINGMSYINYTYGMEKGDMLIKDIAYKLKNLEEKGAIVGKFSGDEFGVLVASENIKALNYALNEIDDVFKNPIQIGDVSVSVSYNASVVTYPQHGKRLNELYGYAVALLKEAKSKGEGVVLFYDKSLLEKISSLFHSKSLIERALRENLFTFYYQPYYDLKTMQIAGLEALVRIKLPDGSVLLPAVFIRELEEGSYKNLLAFEKWAINYIAQKAANFGLPVSVNLSARTLSKKDSISELLKVKRGFGNHEVTLVVEITERVMLDIDPSEFANIVVLLKENNGKFRIKVSVDDFGTGYSSLSYIRNMPVDVVKLDMSFVRPIDVEDKARKFLADVIKLLKDLEYQTLAEGVETQIHVELLEQMGCDYAQGYFFCKPVPEEEIIELIK